MSNEHSDTDPLQRLWQSHEPKVPAPSPEQIRRRAGAFSRTIFWRNMREYGAGVLVAFVFTRMALQPEGSTLYRLACGLIAMGDLLVCAFIYRNAGAAKPPVFAASTREHLLAHRAALAKQQRLLSTVAYWYLGPFMPGMLLFWIAVAFTAPVPHRSRLGLALVCGLGVLVSAAVFAGVYALNRVGAKKLQQEIDQLDRWLGGE